MIKIINSNTNEEHIVAPTIFPDKTSQVWKLPEQFEGELITIFKDGKLVYETSLDEIRERINQYVNTRAN